MESHQRRGSKTTLCHRYERWLTVWFDLAGLWENWRNPNTGDWERTFAVITVPSNELVAHIHNRMPAILKPETYDRWLGLEPDPHDLLITYPSAPMTMIKLKLKEKDDLIASIRQEMEAERKRISTEEAKKARIVVAADLDRRTKELIDLREVLSERDSKLAEAQNAQADKMSLPEEAAHPAPGLMLAT